jgi:type II secretory pathway component GspD/PulD (secretin)
MLGAASSGFAQGEPASAERPQAFEVRREGGRMRFAEEVELRLLLFAAAESVSTPIEFDPERLVGTVHMQPGLDYSAEDLWEQAGRELRVRGLTTVQPPGSAALRVVTLEQAASIARIELPSLEGAVAGYVRVLRPLEHRQPSEVIDTLRLLVSQPGGSVSAAEEAGAVLIADYRPQVAQTLRALNLLDVHEADPGVLEVPLEHLSPVAMGALLDRLAQSRKAVTGTDLRGKALPLAETKNLLLVAPPGELEWWENAIARFDRPQPVTTVHYTPRRFGLAETAKLVEEVVHGPDASGPWRAVTDRLTGSLIVTTTPSKHDEVNALLNRLEATELGPRRPMRTYPIRHRRVAEVLGLLEDLVEAGALEAEPVVASAPAQPTQGATAALPSRAAVTVGETNGEGEVTLTADEATNRLIAFGEARLLDQLDLLIEQLDVRHAQVLVEALVVTLNESQTRAVGVELQKIGSQDSTLYALSSLFGLDSPDPGSIELPAPTGSGFTGVVLDPGEFSAVLRALETVSQGRSLTIPKVLVANNQEAVLDSTVQSPYASTNASNTVATTTFGGTFDAGTSITVKPQVADADQILLDYTVSLSTFVGEPTSAELPPPRQENRLSAVATIPDGSTVVVGGLEVETETEGESRVPWLGAIPLIGNLFKNQSKTTTKSRFFVFLRCNVMRAEGFEDLRYVSAPDLAEAGVDDGWPRLEPRVMR